MLLHEGFRDSLESSSEMMADCFPLVLTAIIISPDSGEHQQPITLNKKPKCKKIVYFCL